MSKSSEVTQNVGIVKWFNNKQGYGFLTVVSDERKDEDLFVHHSSLKTKDNQYKYLVQGEYVNFIFSKVVDAKAGREWQAIDVTGCYGGNLMCETRNENKINSNSKKDSNNSHDKSSVIFEKN